MTCICVNGPESTCPTHGLEELRERVRELAGRVEVLEAGGDLTTTELEEMEGPHVLAELETLRQLEDLVRSAPVIRGSGDRYWRLEGKRARKLLEHIDALREAVDRITAPGPRRGAAPRKATAQNG